MTIHDRTLAEPTIVLDLLEAFRRSKVMFAATELGLFDHLVEPSGIDEINAKVQCNALALKTLLNSCVALGLLQQNDEGKYCNTLVANVYLTSDSPQRMTGYIHYSNRVMWKMWANLESAIKEGTHRWKQTFDFDGPIFSHFFKTDAAMREFLMGMHGFGMITSPQIVSAFDLSRFSVLADLGGATGHLAIAACQRYTHMKGIVFDLPHALGLALEMIATYGMSDRLTAVGGDFFKDPLPQADLYSFGRILHDWNDEQATLLVQRAFDALPMGGGLLIGEKILWENEHGPRWALMQSLNMIVCTEGRERTLAEYSTMLKKAGFTTIEAIRTNVPLDGILAMKG